MSESGAGDSDFCGCVYDKPATNKYAPQDVGDLTAAQLQAMPLVGLPIRAAHGKFAGHDDIGVVTEEFYDAEGGKHISFRVHDGPRFDAYREGIKQNWYSHLSLGHEVRSEGPVAKEVSICHLGARPNTTISRTTPKDYKLALAQRSTPSVSQNQKMASTSANTMDTQPDTAAAQAAPVQGDMNTAPDVAAATDARVASAPSVEETPEEKALRVMGALEQEQQEAIASAWTMTSQKLQETQEKLDKAEKAQAEYKEENQMLRKASEETAKQLVASLKEAYDAHGTEMPERYHQEIQHQVNANPTLAQALTHAIPVCASAMSRKRQRTEAPPPSSFNELQGFLRSHIRDRGHASFQGDFAAAQKVSVQASNTASESPAAPKRSVGPVPSGPGSQMVAALRASLRR